MDTGRTRPLRAMATTLLLTVLGACASFPNAYAPRSNFSIASDISDLRQQFGTAASLKDYYAHLPETKEGRNEFIAARLMLYNLEYLQFISQFQLTQAQQESAFDITSTGINLATSLIGSAATKSILGAVAAGLTQSRTSLEKNFYNSETTSTLVTAMNAERKTALVPILAGMNEDVSQYPLSSAIVDLEAYQQAGTIQGALQAVDADSSAKDAAAQSQIEVLGPATIVDPTSQAFQAPLSDCIHKLDTADRPSLDTIAKALGLTPDPTLTYPLQRLKVLQAVRNIVGAPAIAKATTALSATKCTGT